MVKKGDTLIEVLLAVGIFSMIAIAVVAVMSSGTSNAQLALETTLAREEIDTQAEALRYIHDVYIAYQNTNADSGDSGRPVAAQIWDKITTNALEADEANSEGVLQYDSATQCGNIPRGSFILNPRQMNNVNAYVPSTINGSPNNVFTAASTYPRLIFGNDSQNLLNDTNTSSTLSNTLGKNSVQGIYIVAVRDNNTTATYDIYGQTGKVSAFFDFYIRTCWYGSDSETPSSVSTIVRLYDPDAASIAKTFGACIITNSTSCSLLSTKSYTLPSSAPPHPTKLNSNFVQSVRNYINNFAIWNLIPARLNDKKEEFKQKLIRAVDSYYGGRINTGWEFQGWCPSNKIANFNQDKNDTHWMQDGNGNYGWVNGECYITPYQTNDLIVTDDTGQSYQLIPMYSHTSLKARIRDVVHDKCEEIISNYPLISRIVNCPN